MVDFKGERRTNQTHQSSTDPEAKLMRRGSGQPAKLCFGGHALMENRSGLCANLQITESQTNEPVVAQKLLARLRAHRVRPHIARIEGRNTPGLDARTTRHASYRVSQRTSKRIEEIFGWLRAVGGMSKEPRDRDRSPSDAGVSGSERLQAAQDVASGADRNIATASR